MKIMNMRVYVLFWYLLGTKLTWGHAHKTRSWYLLGVTVKNSNEHHHHFHMGVSPRGGGEHVLSRLIYYMLMGVTCRFSNSELEFSLLDILMKHPHSSLIYHMIIAVTRRFFNSLLDDGYPDTHSCVIYYIIIRLTRRFFRLSCLRWISW